MGYIRKKYGTYLPKTLKYIGQKLWDIGENNGIYWTKRVIYGAKTVGYIMGYI